MQVQLHNRIHGKLLSRLVILGTMMLFACGGASAQVWTVIGVDLKGDGKDSALADAAQLAYRYDKEHDFLWFRVALYGKPNAHEFGINLVFDTGGADADKMNWWGANKDFKFDRLLTAWVTQTNSGYQGTIGIGDAAGARAKQFNDLLKNNLQILVEDDSIVIGVKRTDITDKTKMNVIAAVGSNQHWNDDIPNSGSITIDLLAERPKRGFREIDLSRNNLQFPSDYKTLSDGKPPNILKKGRGHHALILVPGSYSGAGSFDDFIARNESEYKFFLITPPGINGTHARAMPAAGSSYGDMTWTRRLEHDILNLITKEKLVDPVIVAERQPGSQAAIELALEHPDKIGGVVLVATNLSAIFRLATRKTPLTYQERVAFVDEYWAEKWFKYVTPETWYANDMPAEVLAVNPMTGEKASEQLESAPLPVKIRYLCEFWASDVTQEFAKLKVPVMALVPGFDEQFLAKPAYSSVKPTYMDSWDSLVSKTPQIERVTIPGARLLLLEEKPKEVDQAIANFVQRVGKRPSTHQQNN